MPSISSVAEGRIDLVFFTGDVAQSGKPDEYALVTPWLQGILEHIGVPVERLFVVPGNHDIDQDTETDVRREFVEQASSVDPHVLSMWMARLTSAAPPPGFADDWRTRILNRQEAFWNWVRDDLGRAELCPEHSAHGLLGYRSEFALDGLHHPIQIVGIDTAWMAGGEDKGNLMVTQHQLTKLARDPDGRPFPGLRLALMHHPATDLNDADEENLETEFGKHRSIDFVFRGHLHKAEVAEKRSLDRSIRYLACGCLFEPSKGDNWGSGIQLVTLELTPDGTPVDGEIWFQSWSPKGHHWYPDDSLYEGSSNGRIRIPLAMNAASGEPTPEIRIESALGDRITWRSYLPPTSVAECWGDPTSDDSFRPVDFRYLPALGESRKLARAVLRLAVHGGVHTLTVARLDDWRRDIEIVLRCMGIDDESWKCTSNAHSTGRCRLMDVQDPSNARHTAPLHPARELNLDQIAQDMEDDMNDWVWRRLCHLVEEELRGNRGQLGYAIAPDVINAMLPIWEGWKEQIADDSRLTPHWLQAMLLASKQTHPDTGLLRLGPRTNKRCLLHACVFALAIDVGLDAGSRPQVGDWPKNLRFCPLAAESTAHLCGLQWNDGRRIDLQPLELQAAPPYVLLAHYGASPARIMSRYQSVGRSNADSRQRIGAKDTHHPIVFTAEHEFLDAVAAGCKELRDYMADFREKWLKPARDARNSTQQAKLRGAA
jgi:predicted phosphodiesterase